MKFKETGLGIIILGAIGSVVGNYIQGFVTPEKGYNGIKSFFTSEVTVSYWSFFTIIMLVILMIYILILKNRDVKRIISDKDIEIESKLKEIELKYKSPKDIIEETKIEELKKQEKENKYKLAKLIANFLEESYPKTNRELCDLVNSSHSFNDSFILETISDLVHKSVIESYSLKDGFKLRYNHKVALDKGFKP